MLILYSFLFCGFICLIAQIILDNTKLSTGHITSLFVCFGAFLLQTVRSESTHLHRGAMPCCAAALHSSALPSLCMETQFPRFDMPHLASAVTRFAVASP